jgi:uncharacterized protein YggT (Ycf19 family)
MTGIALKVLRVLMLFVYVVFMAYVTILSIAFALRLFGVDPSSSFVRWINRSTDRIMEPFRGIYPGTPEDGTSVFDASLLFAIIVYSMLGALLAVGVDWISARLEPARAAVQPPPPVPPPPTGVPSTTTAGATYEAVPGSPSDRVVAGSSSSQ